MWYLTFGAFIVSTAWNAHPWLGVIVAIAYLNFARIGVQKLRRVVQ